jgi:hypothetical protein
LYGGETASDGVLVVSFMPDPPFHLLRADRADTPASSAPSSRRGQGDRRRTAARHHVISTSSFQRQAFPTRERPPAVAGGNKLEATQSVPAKYGHVTGGQAKLTRKSAAPQRCRKGEKVAKLNARTIDLVTLLSYLFAAGGVHPRQLEGRRTKSVRNAPHLNRHPHQSAKLRNGPSVSIQR